MADKDYELSDCKERITWLEKRLDNREKEFQGKETKFLEEIAKLKKAKYESEKKLDDVLNSDVSSNKSSEEQNEV